MVPRNNLPGILVPEHLWLMGITSLGVNTTQYRYVNKIPGGTLSRDIRKYFTLIAKPNGDYISGRSGNIFLSHIPFLVFAPSFLSLSQ